jgi:hypothetical protein
MLNIKEVQCKNVVVIDGVLKELDVVESNTSDGRAYVHATAKIGVDQEIDGKVIENEIPVKMFSMRLKSDGKTQNVVYDRIVGYKEQFTSAAIVDDISQASRVRVLAQVEENSYYDDKKDRIVTGYQFRGSFMNKEKASDKEECTFEVQGVVGKMKPETDKSGEETGRLIISMVVIGFRGKANVINFIAKDSGKDFILANWNEGDTVVVTGKIISSYKTETWQEEQGFGEPITRTRTVGQRELLITGGSPGGANEEMSYDMDSIKIALSERQENLDAMKTKTKAKASAPKVNSLMDDF